MKKKNGIPDRWLAYQNIGDPISGTRFVAFKVPLAERYFYRISTLERFGPVQLYEARPDLGLVIDLTNTDRYYPPEFFERKGILHQKIACPGRAIPAERLVRTFFNVVHEFISHTPAKGSLIGVHCTHGINRTGYMICSYMIRQMLMNPRDAIAAFEAARGHTIERKEYIDALLNLRLDGSIIDRPRVLGDECSDEGGPSSSVGTPSFGQGPRYCIEWNPRPELPGGIRSSSHFLAGPSTSSRPAWNSVSGSEVNIWSTTSRSSQYTWTSMPAPIPCSVTGLPRSHHDFNATGYSAQPGLNNAGIYGRTHLPHTIGGPATDLNREPAHSSSTEYGAPQSGRPIDEFSLPGRSQQNRYEFHLEHREIITRRSAVLSCASQLMEDSQPIFDAVAGEHFQPANYNVSSTTNSPPLRSPSPVLTPCTSPDLGFGSYDSSPHPHEMGSVFRMSTCVGSYRMFQEENNSSPFSWNRFYPDTFPKSRKFDQHTFKAIPRTIIAPNHTDDSSDDVASSSWDSWPSSLKGTSDSSNDNDLHPQYDIGCIPHQESNTEVNCVSRFTPSSVEAGFSAVRSDMDVDSAEEAKPNEGSIFIPVDSRQSPTASSFVTRATQSFMTTYVSNSQPPPQTPPRIPAPLQVLEDVPPRMGRRNGSHNNRELTSISDWDSVLAGVHHNTGGNAGHVSRHAIPAAATSALGSRDFCNEQPVQLRVDVRASEVNPDVDWNDVLANLHPHTRESPDRAPRYSMSSAGTSNLGIPEGNCEQPTRIESCPGNSCPMFPRDVTDLSKIVCGHRYPIGVSHPAPQAIVPYACSCPASTPLGSGLSSVLGIMDVNGLEGRAQNESGVFLDLSASQHLPANPSPPAPLTPPPTMTPPPPLQPLPCPIEPITLVTPSMPPPPLPIPPQVLEDLPPRNGPPNEFHDVDRQSQFSDRDLDWEAILASLHRHTRRSAGRASRYAMPTSPMSAIEGREDHYEQAQQRPPRLRYSQRPQNSQEQTPQHGSERRRRRRNRRRPRRGANGSRSIGMAANGSIEESNAGIGRVSVITAGPVVPDRVVNSVELDTSARGQVGSGVVE